jgi:hypothetical protein
MPSLAVAKIVKNSDFVSFVEQSSSQMRSDKTGSSCDKIFLTHGGFCETDRRWAGPAGR